jgi:hypothetical protein
MDLVRRTNHDKLELLLLVLLLKQAAIMAAADTDQNLLPQQAFQKDINQDLPALPLINPVLAAIALGLQGHLAEPAATDLTRQEDLLADLAVQVDSEDAHYLQWTLVLVQNHPLVNTLLQNRAKKMQQENSKTSKILRLIKNQKSIALLTPAINKASEMKTMKAGAHAKAAAIDGCHLQPKNSLSALNL